MIWKKEIYIFIISMLPVIELRGGIPLGVKMGLGLVKSTLISIVGNIAIIPFLLLLLNPLMDAFERTSFFKGTIGWVKDRTMRKTKDKIKKYRTLGLFLLVAIPLPSTGVWTGSIAASLLRLDNRKAFFSMASGVVVSGIIIFLLLKFFI